MRLAGIIQVILFLFISFVSQAKVQPLKYGVDLSWDTAAVNEQLAVYTDSFFAVQPMLRGSNVVSAIEHEHTMPAQTADFYLLVFLCLLLGMIRYMDTRYFGNLWRAFINPTLSSRQLKEQLQGAGLPNLLMNVFFAFSEGAYIYYVVKLFTPVSSGAIAPALLLIMLICGTGIIYLTKYAAVRFSGWAFRVEGLTEQYLFNVFLINKVLGVTLIPFVIVLAFAEHALAQQVVFLSFLVVGALIANRYLRSWQIFGSFFQYSRFHFFMYLCASELLPLAVLMKLLVKGLMFY